MNFIKTDPNPSTNTAHQLSSKKIKTLLNQGVKSVEIEDYASLEKITESIFKIDENNFYGFLFALILLNSRQEYGAAISFGIKALNINPESVLVLSQMARALFSTGQIKPAEIFLTKSLELEPKNEIVIFELARLYIFVSKHEKALDLTETLLKTHPKNVKYLNLMGTILNNLNRPDEALNCFHKAIYATNEVNLSSVWNYVSSKKITIEDNKLITDIQNMYLSEKIKDSSKRSLAFSLGKIYEDFKEYELAMDCWDVGNILTKRKFNFSSEKLSTQMARMYSNQPLKKLTFHPHKDDWFIKNSKTPIFIVGMPRSGTSLTEQILGCHSQITPLGELTGIPSAISTIKYNSSTDVDECLNLIRKNYADYLQYYDTPNAYFSDKLPNNFENLGWIINAFPEAKIIHADRDPIATCFSIYKMYFSAEGLNWAFDMDSIADFYNEYKNWMKLIQTAFNDRIYLSNYQELVASPRSHVEKLISYIGLEFEEECLNFHKSRRVVSTASMSQVKQPIYKGSSEAWKNYEEWLQPLIRKIT